MSQRPGSRGDPLKYEPLSVMGFLFVPGRPPPPTGPRHGRKSREPPEPSPSDIVMVAVVQQQKRVSDSLLEDSYEKYYTRHFQDGRIAESDYRIAMVAGYLAEEVSGTLAFEFMHKEDVNFTVVALQQMYDLGQGLGRSAYRLRAKNGDYIFLRTEGRLEFKRNTTEVTSLLCINTLLTKEEGEREIQEMKTRYAASIAKCYQITRSGGPLAQAVTPEYIIPDVMPPPELPALPSPPEMEEQQFVKLSPASDSALSPNQGVSPGTAQFANMALYSPPPPLLPAPPPPPPQPSTPAAHYPGVITGPSNTATSMERPTVLRTQSVITERIVKTERVSVLTVAGNPSETPMDTGGNGDSSERNHWGYKEVSVLKRTFSLDADACSSKRLHTAASRSSRQRRRDSQPANLENLEVEVPHIPPVLSPGEQHQVLMTRGVPGHVSEYRGSWTEIPNQLTPTPTFSDPSSSCLQRTLPAGSANLSPPPPCEHDPTSPASLRDIKPDDLLDLGDAVSLEALQDYQDGPSAVGSECPPWLSFPDTPSEMPSHDLSLSNPDVDPVQLVRHHQQLDKDLDLQAIQMNQLQKDLNIVPSMKDKPFQSTLSQLQAQHKKQRQMLHTLKQDHNRLQRQEKLGPGQCVKQNLGV